MEWITTTAKTLPEAIDLALDNLGVDESEAEIVVVEEPKQGFFGRLKGLARVEARVRPKPVRNKYDRGRGRNNSAAKGQKRGNKRASGQTRQQKDSKERDNTKAKTNKKQNPAASNKGDGEKRNNRNSNRKTQHNNKPQKRNERPMEPKPEADTPMEEVVAYLKQYLGGLSTAFGYEDAVTVSGSEEDGLTASVDGQHGLMVGHKGRTLNAIQELTRVSTQRSKPSNYRIYVDVGGYREKRRQALAQYAVQAAQKAREDNTEVELDNMNSSDRKIVHDALNEQEGVTTRSAGVEPRRRVIVVPESAGAEAEDVEEEQYS